MPGPLALAVLVGALLLALGAAVLRPNLTGDSGANRTASERTDEAGGTGSFGTALGATANPTQSPAASPKPSPTAKAKPRTPASPTPRRSPSATPTRPPTESGSSPTQSADENKVVEIANQERASAGCGPVKVNAKLAAAAGLHSQDQAEHDNMSHTGSDGSTPWERSEEAGYTNAIGENVAAGYRTPAAVMDGWMNSEGHRANILNCDAKAIGVGLAYAGNGTPYWTQMFGSVV
ncbi:CAP domain-containing protein [Phytohabitans sp. ZYX-F-186]|uniref:CAP domain-containing protein n=1 Tax=Phytohabitans maris TaxID=3071409 RepID=A0ABU0ZVD1_9ACTN|nr:CAP domain-containing protein [Phytohabitans sp. ZYX-F-186]MDQ7910898.1 CAP domain-containing protein [Phytohabitans sp. ZYX-F-186]